MLHEPAQEDTGEDYAAEYKAKAGIRLFIVYAIAFGCFVLINTFIPEVMGITLLFGLNFAAIYGFSLIILAVFLGLLYNLVCTAKEKTLNS